MDNLDGVDKTITGRGDELDGSGTLIGEGVNADVLSIGSIFAERYKIVSEGKAGGMGVVYKCLDLKLDQEATALKVIHPRLLSSEEALKRFHQEVTISRKLFHEGIIRVHDISSYGGLEYFTMEWLDGVNLRDVIAERKKNRQPFSLEEAYQIIYSLSEALQHAHRYTIHRDIKPENIMLREGGQFRLKLMDFGIAKMLSVSQLATTSIQMGTPYYMAPEQKLDTGHVDKRADIYSVGVILFELLTLENTIGLEMPSEINQALPKEIDNVIKRAVALRPEKRYGDIGELDAALLKIVSAEKGRLSQADEEAILKQKAELAEQKKREAAEAERRKREEERKEKEQQENEEREKKRLEAEVRTKRQELETAERKQEEQEAMERWQKDQDRRNKDKRLKIAVLVVLVVCAIVYGIYELNKGNQEEPIPAPRVEAPVAQAPAHETAPATALPPVSAHGSGNNLKKYSSAREIGRDGRFIAYDNGTVLDTSTNLMWAGEDNGSGINWENAKSYCDNYHGGGYTDWRMPTQNELAQLFDSNKTYQAKQRSYSVHLTNLIQLSTCCPWASETRDSKAAYFHFMINERVWERPSDTYDNRVLPVRSAR